MTSQRVALIDDQEDVREAMGEMLRVFGYQISAFESAQNFLAAGAQGWGCIISDVRMPNMDGMEFLRHLKEVQSKSPIILISGHADVPMAVEALKLGAFDFIEKPVDDVKLVASINRALARASEELGQARASEDLKGRFSELTPREVEVFDLVTAGLTNHSVAEKLKISIRTVESYRAQIMDKMQADGLAKLVRQAIRLGRLAP
jgi:two-component system response regulator FixJ